MVLEDFSTLRQLVKKLVLTDFQKDWLFSVSIDGAPDDLDMYVKDVSYKPLGISTESDNVGSVGYSYPKNFEEIQVSITFCDNSDGRIYSWLKQWMQKVVHTDGTVGLPYGDDGYLKNVVINNMTEDGKTTGSETFEMYPITIGEISRSRENGKFMEFPVTFQAFTTAKKIVPEPKKTESNTEDNGKKGTVKTKSNNTIQA